MASGILLQKGTALWLTRKTNLTNRQIADFCNLHEIEVNAFRMGLSNNIIEINPIDTFLLTYEIIEECEKDPNNKIKSITLAADAKQARKTTGYATRHEIINAIVWIMKNYPALLDDAAISKLLNCTTNLVKSVRDKNCKSYDSLIPKNPIMLQLCRQDDLNKLLKSYNIDPV